MVQCSASLDGEVRPGEGLVGAVCRHAEQQCAHIASGHIGLLLELAQNWNQIESEFN